VIGVDIGSTIGDHRLQVQKGRIAHRPPSGQQIAGFHPMPLVPGAGQATGRSRRCGSCPLPPIPTQFRLVGGLAVLPATADCRGDNAQLGEHLGTRYTGSAFPLPQPLPVSVLIALETTRTSAVLQVLRAVAISTRAPKLSSLVGERRTL